MKTDHTPGKLRILQPHGDNIIVRILRSHSNNIIAPSGQVLAVTDRAHKKWKANAQRLVDCWNACQGIKDPEKTIPELVKLIKDYRRVSGEYYHGPYKGSELADRCVDLILIEEKLDAVLALM